MSDEQMDSDEEVSKSRPEGEEAIQMVEITLN